MSTEVSGREERLLREIAQARSPDLRLYYRRAAPPVDLTAQSLEVYLEPPLDPGKPQAVRGSRTSLSSVLQSLSWTDEGGTLTGSITVALPGGNQESVPIRRGSRITLIANAGGVRIPLWTLRSRSPRYDPIGETLSAELVDQMDVLNRMIKHWVFKKDRKHPEGWTAARITRAVCKEMGVKVGALPKCKAKIRRLAPAETASGLQIIVAAWAKEQNATGKRYDVFFDAGRLAVRSAYRRNPILYSLRNQLTSALLAAEAPEDQGEDPAARPATRLIAHGFIKKKGEPAKKVKVTVGRPDLYGVLGRVTIEAKFGTVGSKRELENKAKRKLATYLKVVRTATVSHPGIPYIRKGDATQLDLPEYGYKGADSYIFVRTASHSVEGTNYTMELDLVQVDYSAAILRQIIAAEKRLAARREREAKDN